MLRSPCLQTLGRGVLLRVILISFFISCFCLLLFFGIQRKSSVKPSRLGDWTNLLDHGKVLGFPSYDQANKLLDAMLERYPQIFTKHEIGKSFNGLTIYAYRLTAGVDGLYKERNQVLLTALMHAREPAGLTVLLYFLGHLMELYDLGVAEAVFIVQTKDLWAIPFVNPDGYIANENIPGTGMRKVIRKNLRPTCNKATNSGVDINRNFGFHWARDFAPCNEEFQGSMPFSEPETQALKKLIEEHEFKAALNFHAFGGMLTHPYNYGKQALPIDDQQVYDEIAEQFQWPKFGPAIKTVGYTAPGESDDWMYAAHHIFSMSPEVGPENGDFWPSASLIGGIDSRNFDRTKYVVKKAGLELEVVWTHEKDLGVPSAANSTLKPASGEAVSFLRLQLRNKGVGPSCGELLHLAVLGTTNNSSSHPDGIVVLQGSGDDAEQKPARLFSRSTTEAPILGFQIMPMTSRTSETIRIYQADTFDSADKRDTVKLCVVEIPKADIPLPFGAPAICHCAASQILPLGTSLETATSGAYKAELVKHQGSKAKSEIEKLCNVAVSLGDRKKPTPAPEACCKALTVECRACFEGISVGTYCASNFDDPGCSSASDGGWTFSFLIFLVLVISTCMLAAVLARRSHRHHTKLGSGESVRAMKIPTCNDTEGPLD